MQENTFSNQRFSSYFFQNTTHHIFQLKGIERVLPHRVNSLERFLYLYDDFKGFECDIIIDPLHNVFRIAHDDDKISSLSFKQFLERDSDRKLFWLDVKNMDSDNFPAFFQHLNYLDAVYGLKKRIIVESTNPDFLPLVSDSGYLTCLYLPASLTDTQERLFLGNKEKWKLISQDVAQLNMLNKIYPGEKKITWDTKFFHSLDKDVLRKHILDTNILICLINIKSPGYK